MKRRSFASLTAAAVLAGPGALVGALAQPADLKGQTVRIVVGFPAGGTADAVARLFAQELQAMLGANLIVDNRAGAGGQIAAEYFRQLPADGKTLLLGNSHMFSTLPLTSRSVRYDPQKDFVPVAQLATFESSFAIASAQPAKTLPEFLAFARTHADARSYGIPAAGSGPHFIGYVIGRNAGLDLLPVPYKGGAPLLADLMGNTIPAAVDALGSHIEAHKAGRIRVLGVTGKARQEALPEVPTFAELGYPGALSASSWVGLFAPPGSSAAYAELVASAAARVAALPTVQANLRKIGFAAAAGGPKQLQETVRNELELWRPIIKESGFRID
uniref:tripartite tricarboxylate transporter substrate-binding protein n=1 Tax=unclassified Variovorax TaxID=663243 RepID=UPI000D34B447